MNTTPSFRAYEHLNAGMAARARGELAEAQALFERATEADPKLGDAHSALACLLIAGGRHKEAVSHVEAALEQNPEDATAQHCLGLLFLERALFEPAIAAFNRTVQICPDHIDAWRNLASAQRSLGEPQAARATIERALHLAPNDPRLNSSLAALCEFFGEHERVLEILATCVTARRCNIEDLLTLTNSLQALGQATEARSLLEKALCASLAEHRYRIEFALAQLLDRSQEYESAFAHLERANKGKRARFDPEEYRQHVDAVIRGYSQLRTRSPDTGGSESRRPVFIIGMPRSGTSLIEQIIAAHPAVAGGGELGAIMQLAQTGSGERPQAGGTQYLSAAELRRLAESYLGSLDRVDADAERVTDKMWENFEYLGFIERLFPRACVIHCKRNPFDTAVSCYFQHFAGENGVAFSYDLGHIGAYNREYERLMAFWRRESKLPILDVLYEDVVCELESQARRMIAFLGLDWSDTCLSFHASGRAVNTASYAQVRQTIYTSSVGRWHHYAEHLSPFTQTQTT